MMVSNLNSLATVIWEDFVSQFPKFKGREVVTGDGWMQVL